MTISKSTVDKASKSLRNGLPPSNPAFSSKLAYLKYLIEKPLAIIREQFLFAAFIASSKGIIFAMKPPS